MAFNKILVANRGEIAVRVMRTAQGLGYEVVGVFSEVDGDAPHVEMADQAVLLGPAEVGESYLHMERILEAAVKTGAEAVHPGYGFLSENAEFARRVIAAGLVWIGPEPEAIALMGDKAAAKRAVEPEGVPLVPGYAGVKQDDETLIAAAAEIGYPVMVKAAAGGGGRGMRLVGNEQALPQALESARSEALKAFGSAELLLEKAIVNPRHVEVQVFGDTQGNVIHLGERDCSIQRRHQKVIEEAPSPALTAELREKMGAAAVTVAKTVGYYGAGTVEFLLDGSGNFYFIEMNTRLQVEHPVTELITGLDLVAWQILVAEGRPLPLTQEEISLNGHAIEARLYAEAPEKGFLPSTGKVWLWRPPEGEGVRVDAGLVSGQAITPFYDAMMAKIIAYGESREVARRRLRRALGQTAVLGVETNRRFLLAALDEGRFVAGEADTGFVEAFWEGKGSRGEAMASPVLAVLAAVVMWEGESRKGERVLRGLGGRPTAYCFDEEDKGNVVRVQGVGDGVVVDARGERYEIKVLRLGDSEIYFEMDGVRERGWFAFGENGEVWVQFGLETGVFRDVLLAPPLAADGVSGRIVAPMPGGVLKVHVGVGDRVSKGDVLLVLEAMKMEHGIGAPFDGVVEEVLIEQGQQMRPKELMIVLEGMRDEG